MGYGARRITAQVLGGPVEGFSVLCRTLGGDPEYAEAVDLISQADRVLTTSYEDLLRKIQIMGQTVFRRELKTDIAFWVECDSEWGQGRGYKRRVAGRHEEWFASPDRQVLEGELRALIEKEWQAVLADLKVLFEEETTTAGSSAARPPEGGEGR